MSSEQREVSDLEVAVDAVIAAHSGDARAAIAELLNRCRALEATRDRAVMLVSQGYMRGRQLKE